MTREWRLMHGSDLADVCRIAAICHPDFPEDKQVLAEKRELSPQSCFVLDTENGVGGYVFAHPYLSNYAPALDCLLGQIPVNADTLYLHDIAIEPTARAGGAAGKVIALLKKYAQSQGFKTISLIAVNGSPPFWQKHGFQAITPSPALRQKLQTYSDDALYMVCIKVDDI